MPGEYIVVLHRGAENYGLPELSVSDGDDPVVRTRRFTAHADSLQAKVRAKGAQEKRRFSAAAAVPGFVLQNVTGEAGAKELDALKADPRVSAVVPNFVVSMASSGVPSAVADTPQELLAAMGGGGGAAAAAAAT